MPRGGKRLEEGFDAYRRHFPRLKIPRSVDYLKLVRKKLPTLTRLMTMSHTEFMANAAVHYPQSWAVVHYLYTTEKKELKGLLREYFDVLREGLSRQEAFDRVMKPHISAIETGYKSRFRLF